MNLDKTVLLEVHDKALLQAALAEANRLVSKEEELSLSELITEANLRPDTGHSAMADGTFQTGVVIFTDASGEMMCLTDNNQSNQPSVKWREVKTNEDMLDYLSDVHHFMSHNWCLRRQNGEEWRCNLEGETGKSRLIVSAAMRYLLDCRFKVVEGDNLLQIKRRTKLIGAGDYIEFYIIRIVLYPQYNYSRGLAYCKKVKINFVDNSVSSGREEELEIKDLELEKDIHYDIGNQEQSIDYDDYEEEYSHER